MHLVSFIEQQPRAKVSVPAQGEPRRRQLRAQRGARSLPCAAARPLRDGMLRNSRRASVRLAALLTGAGTVPEQPHTGDNRRSNYRPPSALLPAEGAMVPRHSRLSGGGPGSGCAGDKQGSPASAGAAPQGLAGADSAALQPARTQAAPVPSGRQLGPRSAASGAAPCPAASRPRPALQQVGGH